MKILSLLPLPALALTFALSSCQPSKTDAAASGEMNPGQKLVMESIAAHGGADKWYQNGLLQFRWRYYMTDRGPEAIADSLQTVNTKTLAVTHTVPNSDMRFGWNDGQAWQMPADGTFPTPPAFWALTPTYFIGIPFVFNDPNALFEELPETMAFEGKDYTQVKITYTAEAGDSPDDYYVLLIDPETKVTRGAYYIVTSKLVAPNGPGPEKFITLDGLKEFDGVMLSTSHRTFTMEDGKIGEQMRHTEIEEISFLPEGAVDLSIPEGATQL